LPEQLPSDVIHVRLQAGAAFGSEGHPTTRLCLQALDHLSGSEGQGGCFGGAAVDIGTGSGVLALVAAMFGCPTVLALDTDPCARREAAANVALNHCQHLIHISEAPFDQIGDSFHLILANLRFPTLVQLLPWAAHHLHPEGRIVVSGYLQSESPSLETRFDKAGFARCWCGVENRWAGSCFAWKGAEPAVF
jgi:ribosomal protein L11 methylase PrmA